MPHIAVFSIPAHGHVNPSLALVRELVGRGHRVSYAIAEPFDEVVAGTGAVPVRYDSTLASSAWPEDALGGMELFLDEARHVMPQQRAAFAGDTPDLVLYDIAALTARVLAAGWGVEAVQLSPSMVAWEGFELDLPGIEGFHARLEAWHGLAIGGADYLGRPDHGLVLIPRVLQPHAELVSDRFRFVGPCLDERAHQGGWEAPDGRPVLLASLGSAYNREPAVFRACADALADSEWHVVLATPADLGPLPANAEQHAFVPQLAVLARARAFVTHAGAGGTQEGLWYGVPMVAVPQAVDQFMNADRIVELGVGRRVDEPDAHTLAAAVASLAELAPRSAELAAELRATAGPERAADAVESFLR
jgi:MGT family glycosyltransferase